MEKSRIAALIDGIFAVAMTLLVLDLKLPEGVKLSTDSEMWRQLRELRTHFSTYVLSFIVLGTYWIAHHSLYHFVRRVNRSLLWLNLLFLLFVTFLPFSTNLLSGHYHLRIPVVVYGTNLLLLSLLFLLNLLFLSHHPELTHNQLTPQWIAHMRRRTMIPVAISLASIALAFFRPETAVNVYWLLLVFHFLPGRHHHPPQIDE